MPTPTKLELGWIGTGRMGFDMAKRLAQAGCDIAVWNRTKAKASGIELKPENVPVSDGLSS